MYAAGKSYSEILAFVDASGIKSKKGTRITDNTLHHILKNERYTGVYTWFEQENKYMRKWVGRPGSDPVRIEAIVPRIVDDETWRRVCRRRAENKQNRSNKGKRRQYLLSGLIQCGHCGSNYTGHASTIKKNGHIYEYNSYLCGRKERSRDCGSPNIAATEIED